MKWIAEPVQGDRLGALQTMYPTDMKVLTDPDHSKRAGMLTSTTYGVVLSGRATINASHGEYELFSGSYFSIPSEFHIELDDGADNKVVLIERRGFLGQQVFGAVEPRGRLTYIDGCSDSLLVYPPRMGDPCLNHLHFPGDILQTQHTHPSIRMGVVLRGEGVSWRGANGDKGDLRTFMEFAAEHGLYNAVALLEKWRQLLPEQKEPDRAPVDMLTLEYSPDENENVDRFNFPRNFWKQMFGDIEMLYHLRAGGVFLLEEGELHSFATVPGGGMDIVAWHPDSDWGPTDSNHPMLNRTYIGK